MMTARVPRLPRVISVGGRPPSARTGKHANKYANYRKGRELRFIVDQLSDAQEKLMKSRRFAAVAEQELERITDVVAAIATQLRNES